MRGIPEFCIYAPGADTAQNDSRRQSVRAVTVHRTQGTDSRNLGKTRHHSTPGTFNFLVRDEAVYCYYPADVRCSHAAGANHSGPGIEIEGFTGAAISAKQSSRLGQIARWLHTTYGVPLELYDGPRTVIDGTAFAKFVNHNSVQTEPQYRHTDRIPVAEFLTAVGVGPVLKGTPAMLVSIDGQTVYVFDPSKPPGGRFRAMENSTLNAANKDKAALISQQTYDWLNSGTESSAQPVNLKVSLTGTATPAA